MTKIVCEYLRSLEALAKLSFGQIPTVRPATPAELSKLLDLGVRTPELKMFEAGVLEIGIDWRLRVCDVAGIVYENTELGPGIDIQPLGFVVIGSTCGGDAYALDCGSDKELAPVWLVSHERDWDSADAIRAGAKLIAENMPEFLREAAKGRWSH